MSTPSSSYIYFFRCLFVLLSSVAALSRELFKSHKENLKTRFFVFLRYKKENELWQKRATLSKGKILSFFPPLIVPWLMRRAEFTCPWTAVLCLSMLLNYTGWKKYHVQRNCPHKCDEMYLCSVSDRQVQPIFNLLHLGRLNLGIHL